MKAYVVVRPAAAKRLIAKGVAAHPIVEEALREGTIVVTLGTTNAYVVEELTGEPIDHGAFAAGVIDARWSLNARIGEARDVVLKGGKPISMEPEELLASLGSGDVIIKGGNALDPFGTVGVLMGASTGGTVGRYVPTALARGVDVVIPISVAKSVHTSIGDLATELGSGRMSLGDGLPCGIFPLFGHLVTEIEALEILFSVRAIHTASGGIGPGTGSVSLVLEGEEDDVSRAYALLSQLAEEPEPTVQGRS
jgi:hypothetical protein